MDYNDLIQRHTRIIKHFTNKYHNGVMPKEDFEQELKVRLWIKFDETYCSALGSPDNYAFGIISLEAKKMKLDMRRQDTFEKGMVSNGDNDWVHSIPSYDRKKSVPEFDNIMSFANSEFNAEEKQIFLSMSNSLDSSNPIRYNKIASTMGITIQHFNKVLNGMRNKISVYMKNPEYF